MFPDGSPDLQSIFQQAAAMQQQLVSAQQDLEQARVEGTSGGGLVHATVSGTGTLLALRIDPSACDPDDTETLADLIVAAVQNATDNAQQHASDTMGDLTAGLGGLDALTGLGSNLARPDVDNTGPTGGRAVGFSNPAGIEGAPSPDDV